MPGSETTVVAGTESAGPTVPTAVEARERLMEAAYELFSAQGIQATGIDAIIDRSGVGRRTLYRHFDSKQDLVLAFLQRREERWTKGWLQAEVQRRASEPEEQLLAIFDVFNGWFQQPDFEGCSFINVLLEHPDADDPIHQAGVAYLAGIRRFIEGLARRAGITDAKDFARAWHILMKGSIVAAGEGDRRAARRAQRMGRLLLDDAARDGRSVAPTPRPA